VTSRLGTGKWLTFFYSVEATGGTEEWLKRSVSGGEGRGKEGKRCTRKFAVHVPLRQMALCTHINSRLFVCTTQHPRFLILPHPYTSRQLVALSILILRIFYYNEHYSWLRPCKWNVSQEIFSKNPNTNLRCALMVVKAFTCIFF
jgi:hypothetical protein